jgi:hypothetical protein
VEVEGVNLVDALNHAEKAVEEVLASVPVLVETNSPDNESFPSQKGKRPKRESPIQRNAYFYFQNQGEGRTKRATAHELGVHEDTVYQWAKAFNWAERVRIFDKQINDAVLGSKFHEVIKSRETKISMIALADLMVYEELQIIKAKEEKTDSDWKFILQVPRFAKESGEALYRVAEWDNGGRISRSLLPEAGNDGKGKVRGVYVFEKS